MLHKLKKWVESDLNGLLLILVQLTHMMNSLGWHTVVATPPMVSHGFNTVCPPVTDVPPSSAKSWGNNELDDPKLYRCVPS